jgi:hypothetical protein
VVPVAVALLPLRERAPAKLSFCGGILTPRVNVPSAPANPRIEIRYVVPDTALKVTWLPRPFVPQPVVSSLLATWVKPLTAKPVYTARTVSKLLEQVFMVTGPENGAVQRYHTECVELFEPGSPGCHVA